MPPLPLELVGRVARRRFRCGSSSTFLPGVGRAVSEEAAASVSFEESWFVRVTFRLSRVLRSMRGSFAVFFRSTSFLLLSSVAFSGRPFADISRQSRAAVEFCFVSRRDPGWHNVLKSFLVLGRLFLNVLS